MIPKILHHIWVGPKAAPMHWIQSWYDKHPDWQHLLWDNNKVLSRHWKNQAWLNYYWDQQIWHGVADVIRYEILFEMGGFMPGADSECLRPVDELLENDFESYAVYENEQVAKGLVTPLYACKEGSRFAKMLIDELALKSEIGGEPWQTTGNCFMRDMIVMHPELPIKLWPSHYFNPVHHTGLEYKGSGKIYAKQFWGTTQKLYK